jgi:hypothetical protein
VVDELRDRSFGAYIKATTTARGSGLRLAIVACFSAGLIISQGIFGLVIVLVTPVGSVLLAYPLWRRWGRMPT